MVKRNYLQKVAGRIMAAVQITTPFSCLLLFSLLMQTGVASAQTLRERLQQKRQQHQSQSASVNLPAPREYAYGTLVQQKLDVYQAPHQASGLAPVIVMVHGGGWRHGDKRSPGLLENKWQHWGAQGTLLVSVNYRLLPETKPDGQVADVATALAWLQRELPALGGDPKRLILMGHSAGAHLITLLSASTALQQQFALQPWQLSVALDSAVYDIPTLMQARHLPLYDAAFGNQLSYWQQLSPLSQLQAGLAPFLAICSSQRRDGACQQAQTFVDKARSTGARAELLPVDLSHGEINHLLGGAGSYTSAVDALIGKLIGTL